MTLEDFINETLCPARVVTHWHEEMIRLCIRLGDKERLMATVAGLCREANVELPGDLTIPD